MKIGFTLTIPIILHILPNILTMLFSPILLLQIFLLNIISIIIILFFDNTSKIPNIHTLTNLHRNLLSQTTIPTTTIRLILTFYRRNRQFFLTILSIQIVRNLLNFILFHTRKP